MFNQSINDSHLLLLSMKGGMYKGVSSFYFLRTVLDAFIAGGDVCALGDSSAGGIDPSGQKRRCCTRNYCERAHYHFNDRLGVATFQNGALLLPCLRSLGQSANLSCFSWRSIPIFPWFHFFFISA